MGKETLFIASDEDIETLSKGFSADQVCRYHKEFGGVVCDQRKRYDAMCAHCGWNPRVARMRLKKYKERMDTEA